MMSDDARAFVQILVGILVLWGALAAVILVFGRLPFLGNLPGDFSVTGENGTLQVPLGTCILVGGAVTALALLFSYLSRQK